MTSERGQQWLNMRHKLSDAQSLELNKAIISNSLRTNNGPRIMNKVYLSESQSYSQSISKLFSTWENWTMHVKSTNWGSYFRCDSLYGNRLIRFYCEKYLKYFLGLYLIMRSEKGWQGQSMLSLKWQRQAGMLQGVESIPGPGFWAQTSELPSHHLNKVTHWADSWCKVMP